METKRKTGLGDSLLLRRTDVPPVAEPAAKPDDQTSVLPVPPIVPASPSLSPAPVPDELPTRPAAKLKKKTPVVVRDRCTLYLDQEVNDQLHMAARIEDRERSEIVNDILRKHIPKYRVERQ